MRMEVHLQQRMEQRMHLSQQMLQNLELLQLPIMELRDRIGATKAELRESRNDILTGRATYTYKQWAPLDRDDVTLQEILNDHGVLTGLVADTPHAFAPGFNYQRGFQSWELIRGQEHDRWKAHPRDPKLPCAPEKLRSPDQTVKQYLRNTAWWHARWSASGRRNWRPSSGCRTSTSSSKLSSRGG